MLADTGGSRACARVSKGRYPATRDDAPLVNDRISSNVTLLNQWLSPGETQLSATQMSNIAVVVAGSGLG